MAAEAADGLLENLSRIREGIRAACRRAGRNEKEITLVGVTKTVPIERMRQALKAGITDLGENRLNEAEPKIAALGPDAARFHFIGHIQSNKLKRIADWFDVLQSMDTVERLDQMEAHCAATGQQKTVYLEVNISEEAQKYGFSVRDAEAFFRDGRPARYVHLNIEGLMGMGPLTPDPSRVTEAFRNLRLLFEKARKTHGKLKVLSMGMSQDYDKAIEEGSTMIRIGTALFGKSEAV